MSSPVVTAISPTPGASPGSVGGMPSAFNAAAATPVVLTVTDADGAADLLFVLVSALFTDGTPDELVYRAGGFATEYVGESAQISVTNGLQLSIGRAAGWPSAFTLAVDVVDREGHATSTTLLYPMPARTTAVLATAPVADGAIDLFEETRALIVSQLRA